MTLYPCPLCGEPVGVTEHLPVRRNCQRNYTVACVCDGDVAHAWGETEDHAVEDWNFWWAYDWG